MSAVKILQRNGCPDKHSGRMAKRNLRRAQRGVNSQLPDVQVLRVPLKRSLLPLKFPEVTEMKTKKGTSPIG